MSNLNIITILVIVPYLGISLVSSESEDNYCYANDNHPYLYASTRTPYYLVSGLIGNTTLPNCEQLQVWMLGRHGTRFVNEQEKDQMLNRLPQLRSQILENHEKRGSGDLCEKDLNNLKSWRLGPEFDAGTKKHLTKQGEDDWRYIGDRFRDYFPELLQQKTSDRKSNKYQFSYTSTQRTLKSMEAFVKGAFDGTPTNSEVIPDNDSVLKPYASCNAWQQAMNSSHVTQEIDKFYKGPEFQQVIRHVSRRLGYPNNMTKDDILLMHTACIFEKAWRFTDVSPWCAVFTRDDMKILEYSYDLFYNFYAGYGKKINAKLGCTPLKDMFTHFSKLENGDSEEPQGVFHFTHSTMFQLMYTTMGIAKDSEPLTGSNYRSMGNRKWRTSYLAPFAQNLAAVFYKCGTTFKVRFYLAEEPFLLEGCNMGLCDWDFIKKKYESVVSNCKIDFCDG